MEHSDPRSIGGPTEARNERQQRDEVRRQKVRRGAPEGARSTPAPVLRRETTRRALGGPARGAELRRSFAVAEANAPDLGPRNGCLHGRARPTPGNCSGDGGS